MEDVKRRSAKKFTIIGNIGQENIIKKADTETIRKVTQETVTIGKENGRYILQNADYLEYDTPLENIKTYIKTGKEYGKY